MCGEVNMYMTSLLMIIGTQHQQEAPIQQMVPITQVSMTTELQE